MKRQDNLSIVFSTIVFLTFALAYNYTDGITKLFLSKKAFPDEVTKESAIFTLDQKTDRIPYYLSLGRTKGPCNIDLDGHPHTLSYINGKYKASLNNFIIIPLGVKKVEISCPRQQGFSGGLAYTPLITDYLSGVTLQSIRFFLSVLLGPISAIILVFNVLFFGISFQGTQEEKKAYKLILTLFAWSSLAYFLSLSHIPRLFLDEAFSTKIHIVLKTIYSFLFLHLVIQKNKRLKITNLFVGLLFLTSAIILCFYNTHYILFYKHALAAILVISTGYALQLFRSANDVLSTQNKLLITMWICGLSIDVFNNYLNGSFYVSSFLSMIANFLLASKAKETISFTEKLDLYKAKCLETLQKRLSPTECIECFNTYSQQHNLGLKLFLQPGTTPPPFFDRLKQHSLLNSAYSSHGSVCAEHRGILYSVKYNAMANKKGIIHHRQSLENLLRLLGQKVESFYLNGGERVFNLLKEFQYGTNIVNMGYIYFDITDYKINNLTLGKKENSFAHFVDTTYFPALIESLSPIAVPERTEGDQIQLFVPENTNAPNKTKSAISKLIYFINHISPRLCIENGYPPLEFTCSVNFGNSNLIIDEHSIRTSGEVQNYGSRMLGSCPVNQIVVSETLANYLDSEIFDSKEILGITKRDIVKLFKLKIGA